MSTTPATMHDAIRHVGRDPEAMLRALDAIKRALAEYRMHLKSLSNATTDEEFQKAMDAMNALI